MADAEETVEYEGEPPLEHDQNLPEGVEADEDEELHPDDEAGDEEDDDETSD